MKTLSGFKQFILKGNAVELAIGVIMGVAFTNVVNALVKDLITPLVAAIGGKHDFSSLYFTVNQSKFMIGDFINALISFLINAAVIYFFVVVPMNKLLNTVKGPILAKTKPCPECLNEIPAGAKRCPHCTSFIKNK